MHDLDVEALISELPDRCAPADWQDRVRAAIAAGTPVIDIRSAPTRIRARPSRRPYWMVGGAVLACAAGLAIYLAKPHEPPPPSIAMTVKARQAMAGAATAAVGDTVEIIVNDADEVRVYLSGSLVAKCPGDAACRARANGFELPFVVAGRGTLQVIAFQPALPPRSDGTPSSLDGDIGLAARSQSRMKRADSIDVP